MDMIEELKDIRRIYDAKSEKTDHEVHGRKESLAERNYTAFVLADYLIKQKKDVDETVVFELLLYEGVEKTDLPFLNEKIKWLREQKEYDFVQNVLKLDKAIKEEKETSFDDELFDTLLKDYLEQR